MIVFTTIVIDILLTALLIYVFYTLFKGTHTAALAKGVFVFLFVYFLSLRFNLSTLSWIFDRLITNFPVLLAVIFQQDLQRFFARLGSSRSTVKRDKEFLKNLADCLFYMSKNYIGSLIVIEHQTRLDDVADNGVILDAQFSQELLLTIFHKGTDLHDGAVIIRNEKIHAAQVFLPIDFGTSTHKGTRHEAGVSFTRNRNCTVFIVSEETGVCSYARDAKLIPLPRRKIEETVYELLS